MDFSFVSGRRYGKKNQSSGKIAGCRVCGWLLMAMLAGQVSAQTAGCMDPPPECEISFSPSPNLLLGESFNVTCTISSSKCVLNCYTIQFAYTRSGGGFVLSSESVFNSFSFIMKADYPDNCSSTLSIDGESDQLQNSYLSRFNNAEWEGLTALNTNLGRKTLSTTHTTKVQVLRSGIPQESIIVQPLDILTNIIGLASDQFIGGNYQVRTILEWSHADSLQNSNGTYYGREYLINGTMPDGSEGELISTIANSTELNLNSRQIPQSLTLITRNELGRADNVSFQISWPEPSIRLTQGNENRWLMMVEFSEPVTDLTLYDSQSISIALDNLGIFQNINDDTLINSVLTFTANLANGQNYTLRLNLDTTQEIQTTTEEIQSTTEENSSNSGIRSRVLPQLLATAAIAAIAVNNFLQGHSANP